MLSDKFLLFNQVPLDFREPFIISGYRNIKPCPTSCLKSIFQLTNETLNFWTHFLPLIYFLYTLCALCLTYNYVHDPYNWPYLIFLLSCCTYTFMSSFAHLFNCMSPYARHVCFFFDYGSLSLYSLGVAITYRAYSFPEALLDTWYFDWYLPLALANCVVCITMSCQSRLKPMSLSNKVMRLTSFGLPFVYDSVPVVYRLLHYQPGDPALPTYLVKFVFVVAAVFLYMTHFPERFTPGKFDILGHSHQLFHICGVAATRLQLAGLTLDMRHRRQLMLAHRPLLEFNESVGCFLLALCLNLLLIYIYARKLAADPTLQAVNNNEEDAAALPAQAARKNK